MNRSELLGEPYLYDPILRDWFPEKEEKYIIAKIMNAVDGLYDCLYHNCLYHYYEEQIELGNDIFTLAEFPYQHNYENSGRSPWASFYMNVDRAEERIVAQNLTEFYARTDSSVSPVAVTGNKLYINGQVANSETWYSTVQSAVPPFFLAQSPEEIRYVFCVTQSYTSTGAGWYSKKTGEQVAEYKTAHALVTLKDVLTGEMLFQETYSVAPNYNFTNPTFSDSKYGQFTVEGEAKDQIMAALAEVVPVFSVP